MSIPRRWRLAGGITIDGIRYGEISARLDRQMPSNAWLNIAIREARTARCAGSWSIWAIRSAG